jgi:hypothetical protein
VGALSWDAFAVADSVVQGEYKLYSSHREPRPPCPGFKLYDFLEDRKGFATADLGQQNVYVRVVRGESCRLHVVLVAVPERGWDPTPWAETIAQLVFHGSTVQPRVPAAMIEEIGDRDAFKIWCAPRGDRAEQSRAPVGSQTCT